MRHSNRTESIRNDVQWTKVIRPRNKWYEVHLTALWHYRDLILLFVWRDFVKIYKQTILGPLWYILQPLLTTLVFTIIFGHIAQISTEGLPHILFYLSGTVIWNYFARCLVNISNTFIENAHIFGKVYFPRLTVPISIVISNLITLGLQCMLFVAILCYFMLKGQAVVPTTWIFSIPLLVLHMAILALGIGIIISSLTTKYRDLSFLTGFGVQLWMYVTPIVYPLSAVPARWKWLFAVNPMTPIVETFRHAFFGSGRVPIQNLGFSLVLTFGIFVFGVILFSRSEKSVMDTI